MSNFQHLFLDTDRLREQFALAMVFDVESLGLHGEGYALGWTIVEEGHESNYGYFATSPESVEPCITAGKESIEASIEWLNRNVHLPRLTTGSPREIRDQFWSTWLNVKRRGGKLWSDVNWPVEANFLSDCVRDDHDEREWDGPYPLMDIGSLRRLMNITPATVVFNSYHTGGAHNPLYDARESAKYVVGLGRMLGAI